MSEILWILVIALLAGAANALIGSLLVLQRRVMLGDAISHSVLFGLVLAYLLSGSRDPLMMFGGAALIGLFSAWLTDLLHRLGRVQHDASIGVVFTFLFALGVILIAGHADQVDIDPDCVLHGELALTPFDTLHIGDTDIGPRAFWQLLGVTALLLLMLAVAYRPLHALTFSAVHAASLGISVALWNTVLAVMASLTAVASFDAVGAILVVAMMALPANTALVFARSLQQMLIGAVLASALAVLGGLALAAWLDASIAAAIVVAAGLLLALALALKAFLRRSSAAHRETPRSQSA
ncbi:MAG: metal ABC transporter permease [Halothiobacillaceae bacterium]|jgi:manganese/zinc/iron transport system permease protein|nr:metal ABC transporter permease [Halothiobacillaceae bacterium]MDY0049344.1 metal ABC transporter permease [Halothiobacillaceae bacterium]